MSIALCDDCGRFVDTDFEDVLSWNVSGNVTCERHDVYTPEPAPMSADDEYLSHVLTAVAARHHRSVVRERNERNTTPEIFL